MAVGVCDALEKDDVVYTHHRSHNHYLLKGGRLLCLVAELLGREAGCSRGRGGSVHLTDRSLSFVGSSPILCNSGALAVGSALDFRVDKRREVAVAFSVMARVTKAAYASALISHLCTIGWSCLVAGIIYMPPRVRCLFAKRLELTCVIVCVVSKSKLHRLMVMV